MKRLFLLALFAFGVALTLAAVHERNDSNEDSTEQDDLPHPHHGHGHHRAQERCEGLEDVDLSDLSLEITDLRKLVAKDKKESIEGQKFPFLDDGEVSLQDIKTAVAENAMGVIRKVVVLADKKKIFAKVLKTVKASGDLTTSVSGSMNTSVDASTSGQATFGVDLETFTPSNTNHIGLTGQTNILSNSSTAWIKKGKMNILQTKATSNIASTISWNDATSALETTGSMTSNSTSSATSSTVILSKKCFATSVGATFDASAAGAGWSSSIVGKGKGGVYTHVLFATENGTSVAWNFAKIILKTHLEIHAGNTTIGGTQYITVKSFTETITRPETSSGSNADTKLDISNEIKIRVGAETVLDNGVKIYSTGGQLLFRSSKVTVPSAVPLSGDDEAITDMDGDETEAAHVMVANVLRKQAQADDLLLNPVFVNSVVAAAFN